MFWSFDVTWKKVGSRRHKNILQVWGQCPIPDALFAPPLSCPWICTLIQESTYCTSDCYIILYRSFGPHYDIYTFLFQSTYQLKCLIWPALRFLQFVTSFAYAATKHMYNIFAAPPLWPIPKSTPTPLKAAVNIRMTKVIIGCDPKFFLPKIYYAVFFRDFSRKKAAF